MSEAQTESPPVTNRWVRIAIAAPPEGVDIEMTEDGLLWRSKPRKTVQVFQSAPDPEADAKHLAEKQEEQFERHVIEWAKGQYLAMFEQPDAEATPAPEPAAPAWVDTVAEQEVKTDDLLDLMRTDPASAEDVVQKFSKVGRKKFTELLNVELAELQQERGGPREALKRENEIEALLGLFARVGEM